MRKTYPGKQEAEKARKPKESIQDEEPDMIGMAPNYEKFEDMGWSVEETLVWLNID